MADKIRALELIGRHLGAWAEKAEHSGNVDLGVSADTLERLDDGELRQIRAAIEILTAAEAARRRTGAVGKR